MQHSKNYWELLKIIGQNSFHDKHKNVGRLTWEMFFRALYTGKKSWGEMSHIWGVSKYSDISHNQ